MNKYCFSSIFSFVFMLSFYIQGHEGDQVREPRYKIVILLHLYNLNLMDEFITRINEFIKVNNQNKYYIKITIPVDSNVAGYRRFESEEKLFFGNEEAIYKSCLSCAPYHPKKITLQNCIKLHLIKAYLERNFLVDKNDIQILFSENRGVDVGSFLLLLDQLINQNIEHDFIIKLHTKTHTDWRRKLLSMLDIDLNKSLENYECIYACDRYLSTSQEPKLFAAVLPHCTKLLHYFNLPYKDGFSHCAGTMFIASSKITEFFKNCDRLKLFNMLNVGFPRKKSLLLEHGLEVFLGYCFDYLQLKKYVLSNILSDRQNNYR